MNELVKQLTAELSEEFSKGLSNNHIMESPKSPTEIAVNTITLERVAKWFVENHIGTLMVKNEARICDDIITEELVRARIAEHAANWLEDRIKSHPEQFFSQEVDIESATRMLVFKLNFFVSKREDKG